MNRRSFLTGLLGASVVPLLPVAEPEAFICFPFTPRGQPIIGGVLDEVGFDPIEVYFTPTFTIPTIQLRVVITKAGVSFDDIIENLPSAEV